MYVLGHMPCPCLDVYAPQTADIHMPYASSIFIAACLFYNIYYTTSPSNISFYLPLRTFLLLIRLALPIM